MNRSGFVDTSKPHNEAQTGGARSCQRYPEEFKIEVVKQVTEKDKPVADVAQRLGISAHSLYAWIKVYSEPQEQRQQDDDQQAELRKLQFTRHTTIRK